MGFRTHNFWWKFTYSWPSEYTQIKEEWDMLLFLTVNEMDKCSEQAKRDWIYYICLLSFHRLNRNSLLRFSSRITFTGFSFTHCRPPYIKFKGISLWLTTVWWKSVGVLLASTHVRSCTGALRHAVTLLWRQTQGEDGVLHCLTEKSCF